MKLDNITAIVVKYCGLLNFFAKESEVYDELLKHPHYPGLLSISDVLNSYQIENTALKIKSRKELSELPCPFIAYVNLKGGSGYAIVNELSEKSVVISNEKWNNFKVSIEEFEMIFAGVVLIGEPVPTSNMIDRFTHLFRRFNTKIFTIFLVIILVGLLYIRIDYLNPIQLKNILLTFLETVGLITSMILLSFTIDNNSSLVQKLCKKGSTINCDDILSSKASIAFGNLSWSEIGFFYFAFGWLFMILDQSSVFCWQTLALANIVSLPYTFYSIYYQAKVANKWCLLCCIVQITLWLQFIVFNILSNHSIPFIVIRDLSSLFFALIFPVITWYMIKPKLIKSGQVHDLKQQLQKSKFNVDIFNKLLSGQTPLTEPESAWSIILGASNSQNVITMVVSPYCEPCAKGYIILNELMSERPDLQIKIIFTAENTEEDIKTPISRHFMALNAANDKKTIKIALDDWYKQDRKVYEVWAQKYPVEITNDVINQIELQKKWCKKADITGTPVFLLNGYFLPDIYKLPDLKYML